MWRLKYSYLFHYLPVFKRRRVEEDENEKAVKQEHQQLNWKSKGTTPKFIIPEYNYKPQALEGSESFSVSQNLLTAKILKWGTCTKYYSYQYLTHWRSPHRKKKV